RPAGASHRQQLLARFRTGPRLVALDRRGKELGALLGIVVAWRSTAGLAGGMRRHCAHDLGVWQTEMLSIGERGSGRAKRALCCAGATARPSPRCPAAASGAT